MSVANAKNQHNFVIINGRRVSADNGKVLDGPTNGLHHNPHDLDLRPAHKRNPQPISSPGKARSLDGFRKQASSAMARRNHTKQTPAAVVHRRTVAKSVPTQSTHRVRRQAPTQAKPEEPAITKQQSLRNEQPVPRAVLQTARLTEARAQRAEIYRQHNMVTRFGKITTNRGDIPYTEISTIEIEPIERNIGIIVARHNIDVQHTPIPTTQTVNQLSDERKLHLRALLTARRTVSYAASAMVIVVIVGLVAYLNAPNMSIQVAASRAGIQADMPNYQPSGFTQTGPIEYEPGQVVLSYSTATDARNFRISQQSSNWDSASLLANYVQEKASDYDVIEEGGLTIYTFNGSNATWVNGGIWYTIEGQSLLTSQQIASIATSF